MKKIRPHLMARQVFAVWAYRYSRVLTLLHNLVVVLQSYLAHTPHDRPPSAPYVQTLLTRAASAAGRL